MLYNQKYTPRHWFFPNFIGCWFFLIMMFSFLFLLVVHSKSNRTRTKIISDRRSACKPFWGKFLEIIWLLESLAFYYTRQKHDRKNLDRQVKEMCCACYNKQKWNIIGVLRNGNFIFYLVYLVKIQCLINVIYVLDMN